MKESLELREQDDFYKVFWSNGKYLGDMVKDVDGFYGFWFSSSEGSWSSYPFRLLADKLDELNAEWQKEIEDYFRGQDA